MSKLVGQLWTEPVIIWTATIWYIRLDY